MKKLFLIFNKVVNKIKIYRQKIIEKKKINEKRRKQIYKNIKISKEDKKKTQEFYKKHYGKKISLKWHKEYYAISGKYDYKYFPELLFIPGFERLSNNKIYVKSLQDKNVLPLIIKGLDYVKMPTTIISCSNGILKDSNNSILTIDEALINLNNIESFFIKPSIDSNSGKNCKLIKKINNKYNICLKQLLDGYGKDFVIQELVQNSNNIKQLNPSSLNTFRVITYILDGKIYHFPVILRLGRNGQVLDNAHAGGIFIGVTDDGNLLDFATTEFGEKFYKHPDTNVLFDGYHINNFNKLLDAAYKLQALFPKVGCINFDLTLNENEEVVLIEANMEYGAVWLPQMAHGKCAFGNNTARILEIVRKNKKLY